MVCEICGSQKIKKENDVFICQECGTEYSLEEARKLLKEVDGEASSEINIVKVAKEQNTDVSGKDKLITLLYYWALNLSKLPDITVWFGYEYSALCCDEFWSETLPNIVDLKIEKHFLKIDYKKVYSIDGFRLNTRTYGQYYDAATRFDKEKAYIAARFYNSELNLDMILENIMKKSSNYNRITSFFERYGNTYFFKWGLSDGYPLKVFYTSESDHFIAYAQTHYDKYISDPSSRAELALYSKEPGWFGTKFVPAPSNVQSSFVNILKKSADTVKEFVREHNQLMDYYSSKYEEVCEITKEIMKNCKDLEKELFLPIKYRNLSTIFNLIDLLRDGKATNWTDLINLYDTHQYRLGVYEKLDAINSKLDSIQQTLIVGFTTTIQGLGIIQSQLNSIDSRMSIIANDVSKIRKNTFITMWNSL